ncbi:MAG TPA: methyltransferase domain-containing protein, partial [Chloroflexota bacterium]|nr:methyltransferase domain-containing protein [Chloroflexota bacterium]
MAVELEQARADLAAEWRRADPRTPEEIHDFYVGAHGMQDDLEAWHATPERAAWTRMLVSVAQQSEAACVVDLGCGAGHDLLALQSAGIAELHGVEPNRNFGDELCARGITVHSLPESAPIERAHLLICIDVLEHLPGPEAFLDEWAARAHLGALLFEATATHDTGTPLHLPGNRGWQPGRWLEQHGWVLVDYAGRARVWRRDAETGRQTASLLSCAHKVPSFTLPTIRLMGMDTLAGDWRLQTHVGDASLPRGRSMLVSDWWARTGDDAFLMVDDDITFDMRDAERAIELVRSGHDIVGGAYPVRNGAHLALRSYPNTEVWIGPGLGPLEIQYAATGWLG